MRIMGRSTRRGAAMVEFAFAVIPVLLTLISLFELSRGLWIYHTLAYAAREGTRYAAVHGRGCNSPRTCSVNVGNIVTVIKNAGASFSPSSITVTMTPSTGTAVSGTLAALSSSTTRWPPQGANAPGEPVQISLSYPFFTFLTRLWTTHQGNRTFNLPASSRELIRF